MAVYGVDALNVFGNDVAVRIHAEGADLVAVLLCAIDELGFVHNVGDVLKHGRRKLDAHADIDLVVYKLHAELAALLGEPLGSASAGRNDEVAALYVVAFFEAQRVAVAVAVYAAHLGAEAIFYYLAQILVHVLEDAQIVFCSEMLDLCLKQVKIVLERLALERSRLGRIGGEGLVGRAVFHVDGIDVVYKLHDLVIVHEIGQPAAELCREIVLAVGKRTCAAEAAHGVAHAAMDALLDLACDDGAVS